MKRLDLNNLDVQEMNTVEMTKVEGGGLLSINIGSLSEALAPVTGAVKSILNDTFAFLNKQLSTVLGALGGL